MECDQEEGGHSGGIVQSWLESFVKRFPYFGGIEHCGQLAITVITFLQIWGKSESLKPRRTMASHKVRKQIKIILKSEHIICIKCM